MKVCRNCYTENPLDAVLCTKCGMSLTRAATGEEAVKLKELGLELEEERRRLMEQPLSASAIAYLFGEEFARPWDRTMDLRRGLYNTAQVSGLLGVLLGYVAATRGRSLGDYRVHIPHSGEAVHGGDLSIRLWEAAFVFLVQEGYISLHVERTRTLLGATEAVAITQNKDADDLPPSLERAIIEAVRGDPKEDGVKAVVRRVIGRRRANPWKRAVDIVEERLLETGWLARAAVPTRGGYSPLAPTEEAATLLAAMTGEPEVVRARLETFATAFPHLQQTLLRDVRAAIRARIM